MMRVLCLVGFAALGVAACDDPCGELEDQCGNCPGSDDQSKIVENTCNDVVDVDDDDACDAALDSKVYVCP